VRFLAEQQSFQRHPGHLTAVTIGGEPFRLFAGQGPDGRLGEVTVSWRTHGSSAAGLLDSYTTALSLGLGHGVPLTDLLRPGLGLRFAPGGRTDDPEVPRASSLVDYCCRRLAIDWLPYPERAALGVLTPAERLREPLARDLAG
jgi:ribonucleoside-diphosphate reductase alpha chain